MEADYQDGALLSHLLRHGAMASRRPGQSSFLWIGEGYLKL